MKAESEGVTADLGADGGRKVSTRDIQLVQNLIERCLQLYMSQREVVSTLHAQADIEPGFTGLVWQVRPVIPFHLPQTQTISRMFVDDAELASKTFSGTPRIACGTNSMGTVVGHWRPLNSRIAVTDDAAYACQQTGQVLDLIACTARQMVACVTGYVSQDVNVKHEPLLFAETRGAESRLFSGVLHAPQAEGPDTAIQSPVRPAGGGRAAHAVEPPHAGLCVIANTAAGYALPPPPPPPPPARARAQHFTQPAALTVCIPEAIA